MLSSAEFGDNQSIGLLHPNKQGDSHAGLLDMTLPLCLLEHLLSHLPPPTPPQGLSEAGVSCYVFSLGFS